MFLITIGPQSYTSPGSCRCIQSSFETIRDSKSLRIFLFHNGKILVQDLGVGQQGDGRIHGMSTSLGR